ncbi:MAG: Prepilin peptidase [Edaphobacter sp.]|nr:Prepilin peptidase [Edaphobacter sp.]
MIFILAASFLIGLLFGSFLNVCISRIPNGESIVRPRSRCPQCRTPIGWYDNIPLLSWLILRGRCRDCKTKIPWRYPLIELSVGIWFITRGWQLGYLVDLAKDGSAHLSDSDFLSLGVAQVGLTILGFFLIGLMVMDWQTMILPDAFTLTGIAIGLFLVCIQAIFLGPGEDEVHLTKHSLHLTSPGGVTDHGNVFLTGPESLIVGRIVAICGAALLLLLIRWLYRAVRHREGMGLGDVKLLAMIAAFLGFWPAVLSLFVGTLAAAFYGAILLARGKAGATSKLPFGSFLCLGGLVAAVFGNRLIDRYIALLR